MPAEDSTQQIVTFYRFIDIADPERVRNCVSNQLDRRGYRGTILFASEGVNATIAHISREALEYAIQTIRDAINVGELDCKWSKAAPSSEVFHRFKVRCQPEIVSFDGPLHEEHVRGELVSAERWHEILADPEILVVDARNRYETQIGRFEGAVDLEIDHFLELPRALAEKAPHQDTRVIAIYCTGGIRCEKASRWMLQNGYQNVYQLKNGILGYLSNTTSKQNGWQGECFVFDQRVSLTSTLEQGDYTQCYACRRPISPEQRSSPDYREGISCPICVNETTELQKSGFEERMKQVKLSEQQGIRHLGVSGIDR